MRKALLVFVLISLFIGCDRNEDSVCSQKCDLVPDPGPCKAYFPRYYFDKTTGKCKEFIWGGCEGSVPYETLEECEQCKCSLTKN